MKFTILLPNIEVSGGNRANFELANALEELGHEVNVFYPILPGRDGQGWSNLRKTGVQLVKGVRNCLTKLSWFPLKAKLHSLPFVNARALKDGLPKADFILFSWWAHALLLERLPEQYGKPVHLIRSMEFWGGPGDQVTAAYRATMPKIVTSEHLREQYESQFGEVSGIVPDAVSLTLFNPGDRASGMTKDKPLVLGMMYRRQPLKRMADGIEVLRNVMRKFPKAQILLFGEKLKREDRRRLAQLPGYRHMLFPTGEALRDVYRSLDVFLFTSGPEEAFGLPPLEAMACGCAVVSTRIGAVASYSTDQVSALHCEVGDIAGMTAAVAGLLDDPARRRAVSLAAIEAVQEYSWQKSATKLISLLN